LVLTIARRLSLFVLFIGITVNGLLLVMAGRAGATNTTAAVAPTLHVRVLDKSAADGLVGALKKEKFIQTAVVSSSKTEALVPTGRYIAGLEMEPERTAGIARALQMGGFPSTVVKGDTTCLIRLKETFTTTAAAQARVSAVTKTVVVNLSVQEEKVKKMATVYIVDITVGDDASFHEAREFVKKKLPKAEIQP